MPDLADLARLLRRFSTSHPAVIRVDLGPALPPTVPRAVSALLYRAIVEALTEMRRRAPAAPAVEVVLLWSDDEVTVRVREGGGLAPSPAQGPEACRFEAAFPLPASTEGGNRR